MRISESSDVCSSYLCWSCGLPLYPWHSHCFHENNGQFPKHRHIEGFVECTLPYGAVPHVAHVHIVDTIILIRKRNTLDRTSDCKGKSVSGRVSIGVRRILQK